MSSGCARTSGYSRACGVRQPEHKGQVERAIRYLRERFFAGRRIVLDEERAIARAP